eukprot:1042805_1
MILHPMSVKVRCPNTYHCYSTCILISVHSVAGATLAASISIGFAYTSLTLFLSNQSKYNRNFKKFQNAKRTCRVVHQPLPTNENKLVYFKGNIKPNDQISDDTF